ncbi:myosin IC heavy chain [Nycticebus coucang]|uniref:myosin IC heavy chain n=1 Tax=Nycticebus coucang TaxID=9470 RepID=UPI00234DD5AF|nr:myosin IC heavy chain [Nycticebus coucang]
MAAALHPSLPAPSARVRPGLCAPAPSSPAPHRGPRGSPRPAPPAPRSGEGAARTRGGAAGRGAAGPEEGSGGSRARGRGGRLPARACGVAGGWRRGCPCARPEGAWRGRNDRGTFPERGRLRRTKSSRPLPTPGAGPEVSGLGDGPHPGSWREEFGMWELWEVNAQAGSMNIPQKNEKTQRKEKGKKHGFAGNVGALGLGRSAPAGAV